MSNQLPIRGIYDEWEREEKSRRDQSDRLKDLFKRAKDEGYNAKALRQAFAERYAIEHFTGEKLQKRERDASDVDLYLANLAGVPAHVEPIEEFDPITGEIRGNGAEVAEDEAQVATVRASSSANEPQPVAPDQIVGANTAQTDGGTNADLHASAGAASVEAPELIPQPAEGVTPTSAGHGDESAVLPSAALVVANSNEPVGEPKKRLTFNDPPHHDCLDPERCGGFSNLGLCQSCRQASEAGQVA